MGEWRNKNTSREFLRSTDQTCGVSNINWTTLQVFDVRNNEISRKYNKQSFLMVKRFTCGAASVGEKITSVLYLNCQSKLATVKRFKIWRLERQFSNLFKPANVPYITPGNIKLTYFYGTTFDWERTVDRQGNILLTTYTKGSMLGSEPRHYAECYDQTAHRGVVMVKTYHLQFVESFFFIDWQRSNFYNDYDKLYSKQSTDTINELP